MHHSIFIVFSILTVSLINTLVINLILILGIGPILTQIAGSVSEKTGLIYSILCYSVFTSVCVSSVLVDPYILLDGES